MHKIAVASDDGQVSPHFGHCKGYSIAVIDGGAVVGTGYLDNPGHEPGLLPRLLAAEQVNCIIAGGIGQRAQMLFAQHGITCVTGVQGNVDDAIALYAKDALRAGESLCDHDAEGTKDEHACDDQAADRGTMKTLDQGGDEDATW